MGNNSEGRRRLQIGLLVSHLDEDFDNTVCGGALIAAEQADVNLIIFPGRYINGVYADKIRTEYEYQYNTLFQMPVENKFDVLLVLVGTIASHLDKREKKEFLKQFDGTPVITITAKVDGYPCISVDNRSGMLSVVRHIVCDHGCRKVGYVGGPETSEDAIERFEIYKEVLEENGIEFDEKRVVYGNFSKYVTDKVETLLDRCPDLEAIIFANDQMAYAGYQVMVKRGIRPGEDILVTGFDNDPVAEELVPRLTTVKADTSELGYRAVMEAVNYINNGTFEKDTVSSKMIRRSSCGCIDNPELKEIPDISDPEAFRTAAANEVIRFLLKKYREGDAVKRLENRLCELIRKLFALVESDRIDDPKYTNDIVAYVNSSFNNLMFKYVNIYDAYTSVDYLHRVMQKLLNDPDKEASLNKLFMQLHRCIAERNAAYYSDKLEDMHFLTWQTNSISRDMLVFEAYDDNSYQSVVDKLTRLHMISSYLFSFNNAVINLKNDKWKLPEQIKLKSYHNKSEAVLLPKEEQNIRPDELFSNKYLPKDRRYSMVVSPLFSNEEHYGILLCELEHEYYHYIQSVTVQLCAALKINTLMMQQAKTQQQLRQSLIEIKENNQLLSDLSKQDDLTNCFNRRGFFEEVRKRLKEYSVDGVGADKALMVFADLDSLKIINDRFGHEEGDFAIRSAAEILKRSFPDNSVIGRIGGDEFVLCAFSDNPDTIPQIRKHIEEVSEEYNLEHPEKPYIIHTSVGVYPFKPSGTVEIGELLSHADTLLYEQKKLKKSIIKQDAK